MSGIRASEPNICFGFPGVFHDRPFISVIYVNIRRCRLQDTVAESEVISVASVQLEILPIGLERAHFIHHQRKALKGLAKPRLLAEFALRRDRKFQPGSGSRPIDN